MANVLRPRTTGVTIRAIGDELLLLDSDAQRIHQLNPTATFIWHCCGEADSVEEIAGQLAAKYAVETDVALKDVAQTLRQLRDLELVVDS